MREVVGRGGLGEEETGSRGGWKGQSQDEKVGSPRKGRDGGKYCKE